MRALIRLEATGRWRSEAIRSALVEAASRLSAGQPLAVEMKVLEEDEADRAETMAVAEPMGNLRTTE